MSRSGENRTFGESLPSFLQDLSIGKTAEQRPYRFLQVPEIFFGIKKSKCIDYLLRGCRLFGKPPYRRCCLVEMVDRAPIFINQEELCIDLSYDQIRVSVKRPGHMLSTKLPLYQVGPVFHDRENKGT